LPNRLNPIEVEMSAARRWVDDKGSDATLRLEQRLRYGAVGRAALDNLELLGLIFKVVDEP
jgi:hypothetical protein